MREKDYLEKSSELLKNKYEEACQKMDQGEYEEAEDLFQEILRLNDSFAPACNKLAVLAIKQEEQDKAREELKSTLEMDPEYPPALTNLGSLKKSEGNFHQAKELYQQAISKNEEYGPAYNNMGVILREEGEIKESVKYLKKARKHGILAFSQKSDGPLYKEPGCMIPIILSGLVLLGLLYWFLLVLN